MKKTQIQNLLNDSLQKKTPKLTKKILSVPINTSDNALPVSQKSYSQKRKSLISWIYAAACVVLVVVVASIFGVYFGNINSQKPVVTMQTTCYQVDINPSVMITADKDGKVLHIAAQNSDADIVLSSSAFGNYQEMTVEECIETFIEESAKLGFIDCTSGDNNVNINVINGENSEKRTKLADQIENKIQDYLRSSNILAYVSATTTAVKDFVEGKGWNYSQDNIDAYLSSIKEESKYTCGSSVAENILQEVEKHIQEFIVRLEDITDLLNRLDALNDEIEKASGKDYWECKLIMDSLLFGGSIDDNTRALITEADGIIEKLAEYEVSVESSVSLDWHILKYDIVDEIKNIVEELKEDIYDSYLVTFLLSQIQSIDTDLYQEIKEDFMVYYNEVILVLRDLYNERINKFISIFEDRPTISQKEYDEYLSSKN